jgi:putative transposase
MYHNKQISGSRAHKIRLNPNRAQIKALEDTCLTCRYIYNSVLGQCVRDYAAFTGATKVETWTEGPGWKSKPRESLRNWGKSVKVLINNTQAALDYKDLSTEIYSVVPDAKYAKAKPNHKIFLRVLEQIAPSLTEKPKMGDDLRKAFDARLNAGLRSRDGGDLSSKIKETSANTRNRVVVNVEAAFKSFWAGRTDYPAFKKSCSSFYVHNQVFRFHTEKSVKLGTGILGAVRTMEPPRFAGKIMSATVSKRANKWYVSVVYDNPSYFGNPVLVVPEVDPVGIDLNLTAETAIALSNGKVYEAPRPNRAMEKRQELLSKRLSRRIQGSRGWIEAKEALARLHEKKTDIRNDFLHKATTEIANNCKTLVIEDLNVKAMQQGRMASGVADVAMGRLRTFLLYKQLDRGHTLYAADRFYKSSHVCSCCGHENEISKEEKLLSLGGSRLFTCGSCGLSMNRDINAAKRVAQAVSSGHIIDETALALETRNSAEAKAKKKKESMAAGVKARAAARMLENESNNSII